MYQALWEHKRLTGLQVLGKHTVICVNKAHKKLALEASGHFGGPWMRVRWHDPIRRYINPGQYQAQCVKPRKINSVGGCDTEAELVTSVTILRQCRSDKM